MSTIPEMKKTKVKNMDGNMDMLGLYVTCCMLYLDECNM